jgi:hypothetical protein
VNSASARLSHFFVCSARSELVLVEIHFSLGKTHKICSLELITEEWWLDFLELEKNFFAWAAYVQGFYPSCMRCVAIVSFPFARLRGMDSSIDESDLGLLSRRRTSLEVEREGNRKRSPFLLLFVFFSPLFSSILPCAAYRFSCRYLSIH